MIKQLILYLFIICLGSAAKVSAETTGVTALRLHRLGQGVNVTQWFQTYSPKPESHYRDYMSDKEMQAIRHLGLRHVRLCVEPKYLYDSDGPTVLDPTRLADLKAAVARFHANDLAVTIDIHGKKELEDDKAWVAGFPAFWGALARQFKDVNPDMLFFEILNEPVYDKREADWFALQQKVASAIRKAAPLHTIIATGPNWGGIDGLRKLTPLPDTNIVYSFHFYDPFTFTHQGATWTGRVPLLLKGVPYPSSPEAVEGALSQLDDKEAQAWVTKYGKERWNQDKLRARIKEAQSWAEKYNVPIYCGEFGVYPKVAPASDRQKWFQDYAGVLKESGIGWAVWGWDDGFGFGRNYDGEKLKIDLVPVRALRLKPL